MSDSADDDAPSRGAQAVRALLERHGLPKHRHSAFVGEFFELSRAAAHQRVSKSTAWTLEELGVLAEHFGETLAQVVAPSRPPGDAELSPGLAATLCAGDARTPCRIWLRADHAPSSGDAFVALRTGNEYVVMPSSAVPGAHALGIARMEVDQSTPSARRVALLDPLGRAAKAVAGPLQAAGMEVQPFETARDLLAVIPRLPFDGYVIGWPVANGQTGALLSAIRAQKKPCALILLTSRSRAGSEALSELAEVVARYKAQLLERPVQPPLLRSMLQGGFAA
ncbi:helix-turn-helix domain-containing protein [Variovorax sp. E3]|uniref:helix-turn-helix domain-containing protein n=1 Tax=Variovorax sp. E3 TaxID=1914993 RepID=UPI0018DCE401|nr:helix-turn-helix domain-containing protein [Variovorax sp. E3]